MRTYLQTATKAIIAVSIGLLMVGDSTLRAQPGTALSYQKISDTAGGFTGTLDNSDQFGTSLAISRKPASPFTLSGGLPSNVSGLSL